MVMARRRSRSVMAVSWSGRRRRRLGWAEHALEGDLQRRVGLVHRHRSAERDQACHAMFGDAAGHDAAEVLEVGLDVQANAMEGDPAADAHANGGDLVLTPGRSMLDPDANP